MPKDGATIKTIDDIGDVDQVDSDEDEDLMRQLVDVQIIGVPQLDEYKSCYICKARVEPMDPPLGRCSKCAVMQRLDFCPGQWSAKVLVMASHDPKNVHTLHALGKTVSDLAGLPPDSTVTAEALLQAAPLAHITYNEKNVINGLSTS